MVKPCQCFYKDNFNEHDNSFQDAEDRRKSLEAAALEKLAEKIRKGDEVRAKKATMIENEQAA